MKSNTPKTSQKTKYCTLSENSNQKNTNVARIPLKERLADAFLRGCCGLER